MNSLGVLNKTKTTVIGPMQFADGSLVRKKIKNRLEPLGITVYDHYDKPFLSLNPEGKLAHDLFRELISNENYDKLASFKDIRSQDLSLIDRSDFIIFHFVPGIVTVGSWEEFYWAVRLKRPIFFITEGGKKLTPFWIFWTIPHKYIYNSVDEAILMIEDINSGKKEIDSDRWKLFKHEYR